MSADNNNNGHLVEYRRLLVEAEQKSQEHFDKTVLSLSGGALGISFVFVKDIIGKDHIIDTYLLVLAWLSWGFSSFSILLSFYLSHLALRSAIRQVDEGTINSKNAGGIFSIITERLNVFGAILFLLGILFITFFASSNLLTKGVENDRKETTVTTTEACISASTTISNTNTGQPPSIGRGLPTPTATSPTKR